MKRIICLLLALALLCSMAACTKRPDSAAEPSVPAQTPGVTDEAAPENEPSAPPAQQPDESEAPAPAETPAQTPELSEPSPTPSAEPSEKPEESPEPSEEPVPEVNANEGKVDTTASVGTATDLNPVDDSLLAYLPELPYTGWAITGEGKDSIMLEINAPADAHDRLLEYIETLRDEDFDIIEYVYGSLYEASNDKVAVSFMLESGKLSIIVEKK